MPNAQDTSAPWPECWTTLSALAGRVPRLRLGTLVMGNTYRHPAVLAKMAVTLDHISGGRLVLGLGAGWQENEHEQYGIPFYTVKERLERLDEACEILTRLWREEKSNFAGKHYTLNNASLEPKPLQAPLPLLVGGGGEKVTLRIAAKWRRSGTCGHAGDARAQGRRARPPLRRSRPRRHRDPQVRSGAPVHERRCSLA